MKNNNYKRNSITVWGIVAIIILISSWRAFGQEPEIPGWTMRCKLLVPDDSLTSSTLLMAHGTPAFGRGIVLRSNKIVQVESWLDNSPTVLLGLNPLNSGDRDLSVIYNHDAREWGLFLDGDRVTTGTLISNPGSPEGHILIGNLVTDWESLDYADDTPTPAPTPTPVPDQEYRSVRFEFKIKIPDIPIEAEIIYPVPVGGEYKGPAIPVWIVPVPSELEK